MAGLPAKPTDIHGVSAPARWLVIARRHFIGGLAPLDVMSTVLLSIFRCAWCTRYACTAYCGYSSLVSLGCLILRLGGLAPRLGGFARAEKLSLASRILKV